METVPQLEKYVNEHIAIQMEKLRDRRQYLLNAVKKVISKVGDPKTAKFNNKRKTYIDGDCATDDVCKILEKIYQVEKVSYGYDAYDSAGYLIFGKRIPERIIELETELNKLKSINSSTT